jgi:hypothetical protein
MDEFAPDTYFQLDHHLYEVIGWASDQLRVRNCQTLHDLLLDRKELDRAQVVVPELLGEITIPADWAA